MLDTSYSIHVTIHELIAPVKTEGHFDHEVEESFIALIVAIIDDSMTC